MDLRTLLHTAADSGTEIIGLLTPSLIDSAVAQAWKPAMSWRQRLEHIYYDRYLVGPGFAPLIPIDTAVTEELFDITVNMGPARPSRWFQQSINDLCGMRLAVDGQIGARTIAAYAACQKDTGAVKLCGRMLDRLDASQRTEYDRLVRVNPSLKAFHKGWIAHRIGNVDRRKCGRAAGTMGLSHAVLGAALAACLAGIGGFAYGTRVGVAQEQAA